jgi:transcriptional regulator with XRE-family HTH domain
MIWRRDQEIQTGKNIRLESIAKGIGIEPKTLREIRYSQRNPQKATMEKICRHIGHEVEEYL